MAGHSRELVRMAIIRIRGEASLSRFLKDAKAEYAKLQ
jgi:hypothetical protein